MAKVRFFTLLRQKTGIDEIEIDADKVPVLEFLYKIRDKINNDIIIKKLLEDDGSLRRGTIILVNGINIFSLNKLDTIIKQDDVVSLFSAGGGG
jgi:molybdopterin synthase sulfur carrier subunit